MWWRAEYSVLPVLDMFEISISPVCEWIWGYTTYQMQPDAVRAPGITPNRKYTMASVDTGAVTAKRSDATCSSTIKAALDKLFDTKNQADLPKVQQQQLRTMNNPHCRPEDRISAISTYCKAFKGQSDPKPDENFFQFLIRSRQGACRHRAPVFVAICRYFGIPSRVVKGVGHQFSEYSLDNGRSWQYQDVGGAPVKEMNSAAEFSPSAKTMEQLSQRQNALLKNALPAHKEAFAKALGLSTDAFNYAIENGRSLLIPDDSCKVPTNADVVRKLWESPNEACFAMGVELP